MNMEVLKVGDVAPDFALMNQDKAIVKLADYRGKRKVVLLFYPMDFSPVCTEEHCTFGPEMGKISGEMSGAEGAVVFGVSCDSPFCHAAFRKQYNIPYDLLSDNTRKMVKAYGMFAGEEPFNCAKRGTVIIGKDGRITFYQEQPMKDPRRVEDLSKAVAIETAMRQRANEGGDAVN